MPRRFLRLLLAAALGTLLPPARAGAQKVYVDYDREADFAAYRTFAYLETKATSLEDFLPLEHARTVQAIRRQFREGGLEEVPPEEADLLVTYHANPTAKLEVDIAEWGFGWGSAWMWDPYWVGPRGVWIDTRPSATYSRTYSRGPTQ